MGMFWVGNRLKWVAPCGSDRRYSLLHILTLGVPGRVVRQKAKDKQQHKEGDDNVDNNFESFHAEHSNFFK
jgi:hypothetical protein